MELVGAWWMLWIRWTGRCKLTVHLDHLQAKWMQTQATTVGLYCRHIVVKCRLLVAMKYEVWARSLLAAGLRCPLATYLFASSSEYIPLTNWQHLTTKVWGCSIAISKPSVWSIIFSFSTNFCAWQEWSLVLVICRGRTFDDQLTSVFTSVGGFSRCRQMWHTLITCSNLRGCSSTLAARNRAQEAIA